MKYDYGRADTSAHPGFRAYAPGTDRSDTRERSRVSLHAGVAELVYAADSKPAPARVEGSSPSPGTAYMREKRRICAPLFSYLCTSSNVQCIVRAFAYGGFMEVVLILAVFVAWTPFFWLAMRWIASGPRKRIDRKGKKSIHGNCDRRITRRVIRHDNDERKLAQLLQELELETELAPMKQAA